MSGSKEDSNSERIPTYEESISSFVSRPFLQEKAPQRSNLQHRIKQERLSRVTTLACEVIEPCISRNLGDGLDCMSIVLLPSDIFLTSTRVIESNVVSPGLRAHTNLLRLAGNDNRASFLQQQVVVQELSSAIHGIMSDPNMSQPAVEAALSHDIAVENLPPRPRQKSWLKRTFGLPSEDHDPTGSTGSWDLGWKSQEPEPAVVHRTTTTDNVSISTRLQEVSFRIESDLGLLESKSAKCIWIDIELAS